jgi:hypothetical protein
MADSSAFTATFPHGVERQFASAVVSSGHNGMVYLDLLQEWPQAARSSDFTGVARLAITPALAGQLADQLSKLRPDEPGEGSAIPNV